MAEPAAKRPRITPRNSEAAQETEQQNVTPYTDLHKLAGVIKTPATPGYRIPSLSSASASRLNIRTPVTTTRTSRPNTVARPQTGRRAQPTTPHAIRALQQRQNAATPGRGRRKSAVQRRETPRDLLRELSKKLAPISQPIEPSPQVGNGRTTPKTIKIFEDIVDEPASAPPRLSVAFDEEDDSWHLAPPTISDIPGEDKENYTSRSVEKGRDKRLSRNSLDSIRASEIFDKAGDYGEEASDDDDEGDPTVALDEVTKRTMADGENTQEFRALIDASRRQSRPSELVVQSSPGTSVQDETFQFRFSEKPRASIAPALFEEPSQLTLGVLDAARSDEDEEDDGPAPFDNAPVDNEDDGQAAIDSMIDEASAFLDSAFDIAPPAVLRQDSPTEAILPEPLVHASKLAPRQRRALKVSKHGIEHPSLPLPVIKRLATNFARSSGALSAKGNLSKDALLEIEKASDWFFEQVSEDLAAYAHHAGRKQIREDDVVGVMKRQRVIDHRTTVFSLAQKLLPRELVQLARTK